MNAKPVRLTLPFIPSAFKNKKRAILDSRTGKLRTLTPKKMRDQMEEITRAFVSQLASDAQTELGETLTASSLRSWIAQRMPFDDSLQWIPEIRITSFDAINKEDEGIVMLIERLP